MIGKRYSRSYPQFLLRCLSLAFVVAMFSTTVAGQGAHYWTRNYGARSTLLSNSVIGSVNDLGAVFYNPGRMGLIQDPTFILSADVYEYSKVQFKDIPGDQVSLSSSDIGSVPGFIAGTFRFKKLEGHTFAYSVLTRQRNDANIRYREELTPNSFPGVPGIEAVSSGSTLNEKLRQQWYSVSWAFSPAEGWGVGATIAGVRYKSEKLTGVDLRVLTDNNRTANYQYDRFYSFSEYGFLLKAGVAKRNEKVNWGVTLTTPMLGLFGGGDIDYAEILNSHYIRNRLIHV